MALASGEGGKPQLLPVSAIDYVSGYLMAFGAMVALARRAQEGGSWLVRVALARVGRWIVDRGTFPDDAWRGVADELPAEELTPLLAEMDAPDGRIRYLRPVVQLSETPRTGAGRRCRSATISPSGRRAADEGASRWTSDSRPSRKQFRDSVRRFAERHLRPVRSTRAHAAEYPVGRRAS